jgi:periplasmic copper chaperone A
VFSAFASIPRQHGVAAFAAIAVVAFLPKTAIAPAASAESEAVAISDAWVSPAEQAGGNVALSMTIKNEGAAVDALLRVRCPIANFSEKHIVDRGEGAPAMRAIPSIPIAATDTTVLKPDSYHVMLLQTRQTLSVGEVFNCAIVFQKAGTIDVEVKVRRLP